MSDSNATFPALWAFFRIHGKYLNWISSFLLGRSRRVTIAGTGSEWAPVLSGVPQGSVLGPVLFICYINDMPDTVSSFVYMHADDTKIVKQVLTAKDSKKLHVDLKCVQQWSKMAKLYTLEMITAKPHTPWTMTE